ncbi:MAG: YcxB family protein [Clostridiales bacterium]|nr:YcxB family protein [Clostridiales bacterium]
MTMFKFTYTLNEEDYFEFQKWHYLNSPGGKSHLLGGRLLTPLFCALIIFVFWIAKADALMIIAQAIGLTILSIWWIIFGAKPWGIKTVRDGVKKLKKNGKLPYGKESTLVFDDEAIIETTSENEIRTVYSAIERVVETERYFFVYKNSAQAIIIPLSVFTADSEKKHFTEFIKSNLPGSKRSSWAECSDTFKFNITINEEDYFEFSKWHGLNSSAGKKALRSLRFFMPALSALIIFILWIAKANIVFAIVSIIVLAILSVLWVVYGAKSLFVNTVKINIENAKKGGRLPYGKEATLVFEDEAIIDNSPEGETKTRYSAIERIVETERYIYVFMNSVEGYIIPLYIFPYDSEKNRFKEFIEGKMAESKK